MLRPFPAEHGPSDVGFGAPGHHVAILGSGPGPLTDGDPAGRAVAVDQFEKDRDAVYEVPASRWGDVSPFNLQTVLLRTEGEEIPEPWAWLCVRADVAWLWEVRGTGHWAAVAVADRDPGDEIQLPAVVTDAAPP